MLFILVIILKATNIIGWGWFWFLLFLESILE